MILFFYIRQIYAANCQTGYYFDGAYCRSCPREMNCQTCDLNDDKVECLSCKSYLDLNDNVCRCQPGYYDSGFRCFSCNVQHCDKCSHYGDCNKCLDGYYYSNKTCIACDLSCETCYGPGMYNCLSCKTGYYYENGTCIKCNKACKACDGPLENQCSECNDRYFMKDKTCVDKYPRTKKYRLDIISFFELMKKQLIKL